MSVLKIEHLTFGYSQENLLFQDFSLEVHKGEIVSIVGPSGVGKSTLFELIAGFLKPIRGNIITEPFSMIFQDPYTSFHPTYKIVDQISDVCDIDGIEQLALQMDIDSKLLYKLPHELSGGQLQRCSILRAIMMKPKLILADEPTSALDNITSLKVMKLLLRYLDRVGILLITHDLALAKWCSDRIIELGTE
ncbi:ABC transporter ATP-binding protein [Nitratiruptor tergarcus]|uniref:Peptide/nickel transport system ATP-binding protein n=1 Tax=Nitratiruptor tergarcus DSM 16512 TaxID=1069081 RepID=A0A1W1WTZ0_9BACT|nr:ATP-binding cassette domain-containing protein [Nitratiruptor tergarcus]SMC09747.1 peptide/nickel transport system ATP-binding protein [Nitratiruptor tergarcus DSM 16512]